MERDFKGVWIPKEIWLSKDLSMLEKVLLVEIDSLDNDNHCTAGNEYFAEFCNCGTATITRAISHLKELGLIEELPYNGKFRTLRVIKMISQTNQNDESDSSKRLANNIYTKKDNNSNSTNVELGNATHAPEGTSKRKPLLKTEPFNKTEVSKTKKKSLYEKCADYIDEYTDDLRLRENLIEYLKFRLAVREKPIYFSQWKALVNSLNELTGDVDTKIKIVQQSIIKGWCMFVGLKNYNSYNGKQDPRVFSEYGAKSEQKENEVIVNVSF